MLAREINWYRGMLDQICQRYLRLLPFLAWSICVPFGISGQDLSFKHHRYDAEGGDWRYSVSQCQDHQGFIWCGTVQGLYRFDGNEMLGYYHTADSTTISSNHVQAVFEDSYKTLWVGTRGEGLNWYDRERDQFIRCDFDPVNNDRIWDIYEDEDGIIWVSCWSGLGRYDHDTEEWRFYEIADWSTGDRDVIRSIIPDNKSKNTFWVASLYGLKKFDKTTGEYHQIDVPFHLDRNTGRNLLLMNLTQAADGSLYGGTWGIGFLRYFPDSDKWQKYEIESGEGRDGEWLGIVLDAIEKDDTTLFAATSQGLRTFNLVTGEFSEPFPEETGLKSSFYYDGLAMTADDRLVVGGYGGMSISSPLSNENAELIPFPPVLKRLEVDSETQTTSPVHDRILIRPDQRDLGAAISTPGYFGDKPITYGFMLEGYDKNWINSYNPTVRYTNLRKGDYSLRFRASTDGGATWVETESPISIRRDIYFWQQTWFVGLIALLAVSIIAIIYRIRLQANKERNRLKLEYEQKLANVEMAALRAQMNPHFMFNSLNSIKTYILKEKTDEASMYLTKFSQLMRAVLRNSKSTLVPLSEELKALQLYIELESLRFENEFTSSIEIDPEIDTTQVAFPPLLIQPYVENAIRHGLLEKESGLRQLTICIKKGKSNNLTLLIRDNGIGREAASKRKSISDSKKKSFGMEITSDRISLIEQTLGITATVIVHDLKEPDGTAAGTEVEITIPYLSVHEKLICQ